MEEQKKIKCEQESLLNQLKEIVSQALDELYFKDDYLIKNGSKSNSHLSERSIMFRLGIYIDRIMGEKFNVDTEYNRNGADLKRYCNIDINKDKEVCCVPDIIIHKRGNNDNNILIIEIKPWWNQDNKTDIIKLKYFTDNTHQYKYKFGLSLHIGKTKEECCFQWLANGEIV